MKNIYATALMCIMAGCLYAQKDTTNAKELEEVIVSTGQFKPQYLKNSVYKIRVIDREKIAARGATDVMSVLNTELGVRFGTDYTLGETDIQLMGMSGQNVKILLDGIPLVDRGSTRQSLSQVDINTIERIEIVEGPMSVMYGTDALAGVINIITKKNHSKGKTSVQVSARILEETAADNYGPFSGDGVHNESIGLAWQHQKGWNLGANLSRNDFGGWQGTKIGREQEWKPKEQYIASGNLGYSNNKIQASYKFDYLYEDILTKGKVESDNKAADARYLTYRFTHSALADWRINTRWSVNASASYQDYERRTQNTIQDFATGTEYLNPNATQDISIFRMIFFRSTAQYLLSDKITLQPGIEFKSDRSSGQRIHGEPVINDYSLFISGEVRPGAGKLNIRPGFRFSKNSVYDAPPVIPSLNLKYNIDKSWTLRGSYARGFRAPALRELYFTFHDASHDIEGNPNLKAEHSNSFNASLSWRSTGNTAVRINSSISGFYNIFKDMISYANDPVNPGWTTLINIDHFKTTGGLLENTLVWKGLEANIGISYVGRYNRLSDDITTGGKELSSFLWSPEVNSTLIYKIEKSRLSFGLFYKYTGTVPGYELATINGTETLLKTKIAGFHLADLTATKSIGKYIGLTGGVKNLFDITRLRNTSTDTGGAHSTGGPVLKSYGRSFFLALLFNWNNNK